jgi:hypothetical protein
LDRTANETNMFKTIFRDAFVMTFSFSPNYSGAISIIDPCHTYHMCHIWTQNMIDMTSMIAIALPAFLRFYQPIQPQPACRLLLIFAPDLCQLYRQYASACTLGFRE